MRQADNHQGWNCEIHTPEGWRATGFGNPHSTRELAVAAMAGLKVAAPEREFRVYPALGGRS